jgi:hypothetical protein
MAGGAGSREKQVYREPCRGGSRPRRRSKPEEKEGGHIDIDDKSETDAETAARADPPFLRTQTAAEEIKEENNMAEEQRIVDGVVIPNPYRDGKGSSWEDLRESRQNYLSYRLKDKSLACLPDAFGNIDTSPAVNVINGEHYQGANLLYLKTYQKKNNCPTAEFAPSDIVKEEGFGLPETSGDYDTFELPYQVQNTETSKLEARTVDLCAVDFVQESDELKEWAKDNYKQVEHKPHDPDAKDIICNSTEPTKYLSQYFAAISTGVKFTVSPEQAKDFSQQFAPILEKGPAALESVCDAAKREAELNRTEVKAQGATRQPTTQQTKENSTGWTWSDKESERNTVKAETVYRQGVAKKKDVIAGALEKGALSCLPGADGYANTSPAVNIANGTHYHGSNLLYLKEYQKEMGFPTAEFVTEDTIKKSGIPVKPEAQGAHIHFQTQDKETGTWEPKSVLLYNVAESTKPDELRKWTAAQIQAKENAKIEFLKEKFGDDFTPQERKPRDAGPEEITCGPTEPAKFLGQYLAAVSTGAKFKVSPEQAKDFSQQMGAEMQKSPFALEKICNAASNECKNVMSDFYREQRKMTQTQTQTQSRGRSM